MRALVVAKAPVPGRVKTRLGAVIGMEAAARMAAAALLDTLGTCRAAFDEWHLALDGDLRGARFEDALRDQLTGWTIHAQRGGSLGERLARAHADAAGQGPTVQIGMDTPQVTAGDLRRVARACKEGNAVLGPAADGGWWVLALRDPAAAEGLAAVPMSQSDTHRATREALERAGLHVVAAPMLRDVDTVSDADAVVESVVDGNFRRAWREASR
jgi:rSAM/selenodomain-associated transferase 1